MKQYDIKQPSEVARPDNQLVRAAACGCLILNECCFSPVEVQRFTGRAESVIHECFSIVNSLVKLIRVERLLIR